jgi:hypothetical protein
MIYLGCAEAVIRDGPHRVDRVSLPAIPSASVASRPTSVNDDTEMRTVRPIDDCGKLTSISDESTGT